MQEVSKLQELNEGDYQPDGSTALFDAIALGIEQVKNDAGDELHADNDTVDAAVSVTIITDGWENASSEENKKKVPGLIKELQSTGKWTFAYIGANHDVEAVANSMNIPVANTAVYKSTVNGTKHAFAAMRSASGSYYGKRAKGISGVDLQNTFFETEDGEKIEIEDSDD